MEKFTNWRDKGTGISPFMPASPPKTSTIETILSIFKKTFIFIIKLPVLILSLILLAISPLNVISQQITSFLLLLFGLKVDVVVDGIKKNNFKLIDVNKPNKNDLIIVNYSSPIDSLLLSNLQPNSIFLIPNKNGELIQYSNWDFFKSTLSLSAYNSKKSPVDLKFFKDKTVFIFAEGTTSNNKAVLPFIKNIQPFPKTFKLKTLILKYQPGYITTPIGSGILSYVFQLANHSGLIKMKIVLMDGKSTYKDFRNNFEKGKLNLIGDDLTVNEKLKFIDLFNKKKVN